MCVRMQKKILWGPAPGIPRPEVLGTLYPETSRFDLSDVLQAACRGALARASYMRYKVAVFPTDTKGDMFTTKGTGGIV